MLVAIGMIGTLLCAMGIFVVLHPDQANRTVQILAVGFIFLIFSPALAFCIWAALKESLTYTHWPVRLNRENHTVYVFRNNSKNGVLEVPWDDVFFTIGISKGQFMGIHNCYLCGHVIDSQGLVQDTFAFGYVSTDQDIQTRVLPHWEYIRRYMTDGEHAVPEPQAYLPIAEKRETIAFSFLKALQQYAYNWLTVILFSPLALIAGIGRVLAMKTSRIPRWPEHVRQACGDD